MQYTYVTNAITKHVQKLFKINYLDTIKTTILIRSSSPFIVNFESFTRFFSLFLLLHLGCLWVAGIKITVHRYPVLLVKLSHSSHVLQHILILIFWKTMGYINHSIFQMNSVVTTFQHV